MKSPARLDPPSRPHRIWPLTLIALILLWITLITVLIHNGPRLPPEPSAPAGAPSSVGAPPRL